MTPSPPPLTHRVWFQLRSSVTNPLLLYPHGPPMVPGSLISKAEPLKATNKSFQIHFLIMAISAPDGTSRVINIHIIHNQIGRKYSNSTADIQNVSCLLIPTPLHTIRSSPPAPASHQQPKKDHRPSPEPLAFDQITMRALVTAPGHA